MSVDELKQAQLEIVLEHNPAPNDVLTWIRSKDDVLTFTEGLEFDGVEVDDLEAESFTPDYSGADAQRAIDTGYIEVFSSYPIDQGVFVTPSRMEAESYAGNKNVYRKVVPLADVAWIDSLQGQYAKVSRTGR